MNIKLFKPYKVTQHKLKRYEAHYQVPAQRSLVVPVRLLGDEVSCDIRWLDDLGQLQLLENKIFSIQNLVPLNAMLEVELHAVWSKYYGPNKDEASKERQADYAPGEAVSQQIS